MFELFDSQAEFHVRAGTSLPHWYQPGVTYFITFRTADSIPAGLSERWHAERVDWLARHGINDSDATSREQLAALDSQQRKEFHNSFSRRFLEFLDRGFGECVLRRQELSSVVADSLKHFDGDRYYIGDFVVMPNHVHLLVGLLGHTEIEHQCRSWKSFTARKINAILNRRGRLWQEESFDHLVRSPDQFDAIRKYISDNPNHLRPGEYHLHVREP